jgi:hypothetical protein
VAPREVPIRGARRVATMEEEIRLGRAEVVGRGLLCPERSGGATSSSRSARRWWTPSLPSSHAALHLMAGFISAPSKVWSFFIFFLSRM